VRAAVPARTPARDGGPDVGSRNGTTRRLEAVAVMGKDVGSRNGTSRRLEAVAVMGKDVGSRDGTTKRLEAVAVIGKVVGSRDGRSTKCGAHATDGGRDIGSKNAATTEFLGDSLQR